MQIRSGRKNGKWFFQDPFNADGTRKGSPPPPWIASPKVSLKSICNLWLGASELCNGSVTANAPIRVAHPLNHSAWGWLLIYWARRDTLIPLLRDNVYYNSYFLWGGTPPGTDHVRICRIRPMHGSGELIPDFLSFWRGFSFGSSF